MNLWILTEERPKIDVLEVILNKFVTDRGYSAFIDNLRILPIFENIKNPLDVIIEAQRADNKYIKTKRY